MEVTVTPGPLRKHTVVVMQDERTTDQTREQRHYIILGLVAVQSMTTVMEAATLEATVEAATLVHSVEEVVVTVVEAVTEAVVVISKEHLQFLG